MLDICNTCILGWDINDICLHFVEVFFLNDFLYLAFNGQSQAADVKIVLLTTR